MFFYNRCRTIPKAFLFQSTSYKLQHSRNLTRVIFDPAIYCNASVASPLETRTPSRLVRAFNWPKTLSWHETGLKEDLFLHCQYNLHTRKRLSILSVQCSVISWMWRARALLWSSAEPQHHPCWRSLLEAHTTKHFYDSCDCADFMWYCW